jgi:hypothetical protein
MLDLSSENHGDQRTACPDPIGDLLLRIAGAMKITDTLAINRRDASICTRLTAFGAESRPKGQDC